MSAIEHRNAALQDMLVMAIKGLKAVFQIAKIPNQNVAVIKKTILAVSRNWKEIHLTIPERSIHCPKAAQHHQLKSTSSTGVLST